MSNRYVQQIAPVLEQVANFGVTTLSASISSGSTSFTVASAANLPTEGQFRVVIDSEIIIVLNITGTVCSPVLRGQEGSAAAAHSSGATVSHPITQLAMQSLLYRVLAPVIDPMNFPDVSVFAFEQQPTGTTIDETYDILSLVCTAAASGTDVAVAMKALDAATPYTITVEFSFQLPATGGNQFGGFALGDNAHNALWLLWQWTSGTTVNLFCYEMSNTNSSPPTFNTTLFQFTSNYVACSTNTWRIRVVDDGTNRKWYVCLDGKHWLLMFSGSRTSVITATKAGFFIGKASCTFDCWINVLSWQETSP